METALWKHTGKKTKTNHQYNTEKQRMGPIQSEQLQFPHFLRIERAFLNSIFLIPNLKHLKCPSKINKIKNDFISN